MSGLQLSHTFTVPASLEDTWAAFNDIESVAGCFPGATVTSTAGDEFKGSCKVKLGPVSLVYTGTGRFLDKDEDARRFVVEAKGKDKRGNGTAGATVTASFTSTAGTSTEVNVVTDLAITGKPAQFGRGVMQDFSDKLLQQFATCLESKVGASQPAPPAAPAAPAAPGKHAAAVPVEGHAHPSDVAAPQAAGAIQEALARQEANAVPASDEVALAPGPPDDALDLGVTVLPVLVKAYWRQAAGGVLVVLALLSIGRLLGRRHRTPSLKEAGRRVPRR